MADILGGSQQVGGDTPHDSVDSGNPVKIGGIAIAHGANPTAVAAADRVEFLANRAGIPFFIGGHPNVITREAVTTAAQTDTLLVSVAGGLKAVVTSVEVIAANSNSVDVSCRVGFATATLPAVSTTGVDGILLNHPGIPKGGGALKGGGSGILGIGADGEDIRYTCSVPTSGSVAVIVSYYTVES